MTDLSKIDFSRLKLPEWGGHEVKASIGPLGVELRRGEYHRFAYLRFGGSEWEYVGPSRWNELEVAKAYTDRVDAFIVEESARLEKKDEAANWVTVPWQDADWLREQSAYVEYAWPGCNASTWTQLGACRPYDYHRWSFRADRRAFPAGYDPEKPRWVEVLSSQVQRLKDSGCAVAYHDDDTHDWARLSFITGCFGPLSRYAIDVHTLKPGVPLHVEPPKLSLSAGMTSCATCVVTDCQAPSSPVDCGRYVREKKPSPRQCTRDFALRHPSESEWRIRSYEYEHSWLPMSRWQRDGVDAYEFRTTAREPERRRVTVEFDGKRWAGELTEC